MIKEKMKAKKEEKRMRQESCDDDGEKRNKERGMQSRLMLEEAGGLVRELRLELFYSGGGGTEANRGGGAMHSQYTHTHIHTHKRTAHTVERIGSNR